MNRVNFIKHQQKCFKRLFKVTVGMMCMTCNANYQSFFFNNNGTWNVVMKRSVCTNLMRDCFPYLNHTSLQGRNMLDMRRMKKFQKEKEEIKKRLAMLKKKISETENEDEIVEALESYQTKLKSAMKLKKEDFTGEGAEDFKFGFRMPLKCKNATNCEWICQKMIKHDGIAEDAVESDQNVKIEDLEADDEQQFESDLVVVDDEEGETEEAINAYFGGLNPEIYMEADSTVFKKRHNVGRVLAEAETNVVYDANGYEADADEFETGVEIDDPSFQEDLVVPEDSVDENSGSSDGMPMWVFVVAGVALLLILAGVVFACKSKGNDNYNHGE